MSPLRIMIGFIALAFIRAVAWLLFELPLVFLSPVMILGGSAVAGALVLAWVILGRKNTVRRWAVFVALLVGFFTVLAPLGHSPISRFRAAYRAISTGMAYDDVMAVLDREFPDKKPSIGIDPIKGGWVNLGAVDPGFNGEAFGVFMKDGHVISKEYSPD